MVQTADGILWGTAGGGAAGLGTVFRLSGGPLVVHEFSGSRRSDSRQPFRRAGRKSLRRDGEPGHGRSRERSSASTARGRLTTLHDFSGPDGSEPAGGLMQASDGNFYGTTAFGGADGGGTLFRLTSAGTHTKLHDFDRQRDPGGAPRPDPPGLRRDALFHRISGSAGRSSGAISTETSSTSTISSSPKARDRRPASSRRMMEICTERPGSMAAPSRWERSSGSVCPRHTRWCTPSRARGERSAVSSREATDVSTEPRAASSRARAYNGGVFGVDRSGTNFAMVREFSGFDGASPEAGLMRASDGMLYGTTQGGGVSGFGLVFRVDLANSPPSIEDLRPASGLASGGVAADNPRRAFPSRRGRDARPGPGRDRGGL